MIYTNLPHSSFPGIIHQQNAAFLFPGDETFSSETISLAIPDEIAPIESAISSARKTLAIIPARGGSKGVPGKNIKDLCGKPLINYTIEAALNARSITRIMVSTENEEIMSIAREYDPGIVLRRPSSLAQDSSNLRDVIRHAVMHAEATGFHPDFVAILLPTHPFRTPRFINSMVARGIRGHINVRTCRKFPAEGTMYLHQADGRTRPVLNRLDTLGGPAATYYRPYGLFSGFSSSPKYPPFIQEVKDPVSLVDIDYPEDFRFAQRIIENGLFDFIGD